MARKGWRRMSGYTSIETPEPYFISELGYWVAVWPAGDTYMAVQASDIGLAFASETACWEWIHSSYRAWNSPDEATRRGA